MGRYDVDYTYNRRRGDEEINPQKSGIRNALNTAGDFLIDRSMKKEADAREIAKENRAYQRTIDTENRQKKYAKEVRDEERSYQEQEKVNTAKGKIAAGELSKILSQKDGDKIMGSFIANLQGNLIDPKMGLPKTSVATHQKLFNQPVDEKSQTFFPDQDVADPYQAVWDAALKTSKGDEKLANKIVIAMGDLYDQDAATRKELQLYKNKENIRATTQKDIDKSATDQNIRQNKSATDESIRQHESTRKFDIANPLPDKTKPYETEEQKQTAQRESAKKSVALQKLMDAQEQLQAIENGQVITDMKKGTTEEYSPVGFFGGNGKHAGLKEMLIQRIIANAKIAGEDPSIYIPQSMQQQSTPVQQNKGNQAPITGQTKSGLKYRIVQ